MLRKGPKILEEFFFQIWGSAHHQSQNPFPPDDGPRGTGSSRPCEHTALRPAEPWDEPLRFAKHHWPRRPGARPAKLMGYNSHLSKVRSQSQTPTFTTYQLHTHPIKPRPGVPGKSIDTFLYMTGLNDNSLLCSSSVGDDAYVYLFFNPHLRI